VLVVLPSGQTFRYGDRLRLNGELRSPADSGSFSYRQYLARQGVYAEINYPRVTVLPGWSGSPLLRALDSLRRSAYHLIQRLYPAPESALISGILLGWDDALPAGVQDAFRATGTSHIIAI
jgi:competence protein ComEC